MAPQNPLRLAGWIVFGTALAGAFLSLALGASGRTVDILTAVAFGAAFPLMFDMLRRRWQEISGN